MNRSVHFLLISLLGIVAGCNQPSKEIIYGSNNGERLKIAAATLYYEQHGSGTPLLLLSGGGIERSISDFKSVIPELSSHFRIIAPDSPGQGSLTA